MGLIDGFEPRSFPVLAAARVWPCWRSPKDHARASGNWIKVLLFSGGRYLVLNMRWHRFHLATYACFFVGVMSWRGSISDVGYETGSGLALEVGCPSKFHFSLSGDD